jgi:hypothetical protein
MNLKKYGKVFTSKFVGTGPSSYKKRIYRTEVSQRLRNTALDIQLINATNIQNTKTETPVVCFKDKDERKQAAANSG